MWFLLPKSNNTIGDYSFTYLGEDHIYEIFPQVFSVWDSSGHLDFAMDYKNFAHPAPES